MCGIAGFVDPRADDLEQRAWAMARALAHRGPDDAQVWCDPESGLALAHTRLAVIDLTECGRQPMTSHSGRLVIVFNGEIYNYAELARDLERDGVQFHGGSDTEVLLAAIESEGVEAALRRTIGMFALAVWDRWERTLTLARDRVGIKPLYFGSSHGCLFFASELKAFQRHPRFSAPVSPLALSYLLQYGYVPAPYSIYEGVYKLRPGHYLRVPIEPGRPTLSVPDASIPFWSLESAATLHSVPRLADEEAVDLLEQVLRSSVSYRMIADVPLGAFLSGGVDSSMIVALMSRLATGRVRTFSIAFDDPAYDESGHARRVASHLGTDHTELRVTPKDAMELIEELPSLFDEPFADSSQLPTFLVSRMARASVTVCLSGDGGDELFAGYNRHVWPPTLARWSRRVPWPMKRLAKSAFRFAPLQPVIAGAMRIAPSLAVDRPAERLQKLAAALDSPSPHDLFLTSQQYFGFDDHPVKQALAPPLPGAVRFSGEEDFLRWAMLVDLATYLPDDLLTKLDRASMAVALEARVPFLDHRVIELASSFGPELKLRNGERKWILRELLGRYVPRHWFDRPKMGFSVPIGAWLRSELREWAESLLDDQSLRDHSLLEARIIRRYWAEHVSGTHNHQHAMWAVLVYLQWQRVFSG